MLTIIWPSNFFFSSSASRIFCTLRLECAKGGYVLKTKSDSFQKTKQVTMKLVKEHDVVVLGFVSFSLAPAIMTWQLVLTLFHPQKSSS